MPQNGRFGAVDIVKGYMDIPLTMNSYIYCFSTPVNYTDLDGLWPQIPNWGKVLIGIGAIAVGVAVTVATGGAAAPALIAGVKTAATVGIAYAATSGTITAIESVKSGDSLETVVEKTSHSAANGFSSGFMWGGILFGASMSYLAYKGTSGGIHIGKTSKPQYGRVSLGYGNSENHAQTIISIQNALGQSRFRIDIDLINYLHIHFGLTNKAMKIHRTGIIETLIGILLGIDNEKEIEKDPCEQNSCEQND